jgi:hypothetical protein
VERPYEALDRAETEQVAEPEALLGADGEPHLVVGARGGVGEGDDVPRARGRKNVLLLEPDPVSRLAGEPEPYLAPAALEPGVVDQGDVGVVNRQGVGPGVGPRATPGASCGAGRCWSRTPSRRTCPASWPKGTTGPGSPRL